MRRVFTIAALLLSLPTPHSPLPTSTAVGQPVGVGVGIRGARQTSFVTDSIQLLSPTWDWRASTGYYIDGCLRIGNVPTGNVTNWVACSDSALASGTSGWSRTILVRIDADTAGNQCLASRAAAANSEWQLLWDRTTGFPTVTCYTLNAGASITATSPTAMAIGTSYVISWGYDSSTSKCSISVNAETPTVSAGTLTMASGSASDRLGSWYASDLHFNGRVDSYGVSIGSQYCMTARSAIYNSGTFTRYQDLTSPTLTEYWDFGNATVFVTDYDGWDWLKGSVAGKMFVQATSSADYPHVVRGLCAPVQSANTTGTALGYYDSSGNTYDGIQPFFRCRPGWHATNGPTGGPTFVLPPAEYYDVQSINGRTMLSYEAGLLHAGTNVPYWRAWCFQFISRDNPYSITPVPGNVFGQSLGGDGNGGDVSWRLWATPITPVPVENHVFYCSDDTASGYRVNRWALNRYTDAAKQNWIADPYQGRLDVGWHTMIDTFDGTTRALYLDGASIISGAQNTDEDDFTAMGAQTTRLISLGQPPRGDYYGFPPTYVFTGAGYASQVNVSRFAGKANATLTAGNVAAIHAQLLTAPTSKVGTAWEIPTVTATHWLDAANYPGFTSDSSTIGVTRVIADADAVGCIRSRVGTYLGSWNLLQATAGKRPLWKTSIINSRAVWRFDGSNDTIGATVTLAQPFAVYMVGKWSTTPSSEKYFISNGSNWWIWGGATGANKWGMNAGSSLIWTDNNQTTAAVHCYVFNGASSKAYRDATLMASGNCGTNGMSSTTYLCSYNGSSLYGNMDIGEVVIVSGATVINAGEQARLKAKWGTP